VGTRSYIVLYFYSFVTQGLISSLMMATYIQLKHVAVFTCMIKIVYRL